jgi:hypothetical protein
MDGGGGIGGELITVRRNMATQKRRDGEKGFVVGTNVLF